MFSRNLCWSVAALSLVVPGGGQFEQGRPLAGGLFLGGAMLSLLLVVYGPLLGVPSAFGWVDLVAGTLWAAADALAPSRVAA